MNSFMVAFGGASIFLCIGTLLRAKVKALQNMLMPACVIAGVIGMVMMNIFADVMALAAVDADFYSTIVNELFTISFISISLTSSPKSEKSGNKAMLKGVFSMGLIWCFLYSLTPLVGGILIKLIGPMFNMDSIYGTLIPFAFCQGPGQAAAFGLLYEGYGFENATMVAIAFSAIGFLVAFLVGVPVAKYGIKRGLAQNCGELDQKTLKGYLNKEEQNQYMVKDTTCNANIETLTLHFALIGLCYIIAIGLAKLSELIPGFLGESFSGLLFMYGMLAAYLVKWIMKKCKIDFLIENTLQSKITGWTADYLVVCAFMAVSVSIVQEWIVPILIEAAVITLITIAVCFLLGKRIGGSNDFERVLGLYGTTTGTVPSGITLVRMVDPEFKTTTAVELGLINLVMMLTVPIYIVLLGFASGTISETMTFAILAGCSLLYFAILVIGKAVNKQSFKWRNKK